MSPTNSFDKVLRLQQPFGGLIGYSNHLRTYADEPRLVVQSCSAGDLSQVSPHVCSSGQARGIGGVGVGLNRQEGIVPAMSECLERYCTCIFTDSQFIWASANELGSEAIDLDQIPRCSAKELANPKCPLVAPDKDGAIRWIKGLSLLDRRLVYLPAVMVFLYTGFSSPCERICFPISTGCAAHVSLERAILGGILEVIERDAISIAWLQELPLPKVEIDCAAPSLCNFWERHQRSSAGLEAIFFDATTDLGVPTIYGLQICKTNKHATTLVSCSSALNYSDAVAKTIRDMSAIRLAYRRPKKIPQEWDEFTDITHGAAFMAHRERSSAFDFLVHSPHKRRLSELKGLDFASDELALKYVLGLMRRKGLDVYVVELSTDEALRAGLRVVRVVIPALQPVGFQYRARYLGHPRLFDAPAKMGYKVRSESALNFWPQPFC